MHSNQDPADISQDPRLQLQQILTSLNFSKENIPDIVNAEEKYSCPQLTEFLIHLLSQERDQQKLQSQERRLKQAKFRYPHALWQDSDLLLQHGLTEQNQAYLKSLAWVQDPHHIIISGPTGTGKTWLSCALGLLCCLEEYSCRFVRCSSLAMQLDDEHSVSLLKASKECLKCDVLILDDLCAGTIDQDALNVLFEIVEERDAAGKSTIVTSQWRPDTWESYQTPDQNLWSRLVDRLLDRPLDIELTGPSLRSLRRQVS